MKVLVDGRMLYHSGVGRYLRNLLGCWLRDRAVTVTLAGPPRLTDQFVQGLDPSVLRPALIPFSAPIYSVAEQLWWLKKAPQLEHDVLFVPHYNAPMLARRPLVVTVHDLIHFLFPALFPARLRWPARVVLGGAVRRARVLVCDSEATKRDLVRMFPGAAVKARVVPLGVDPVFRMAPPAALTLGPEAPYVLFVGSVKPVKNLGGLLSAMELVQRRRPDVALVLVGRSFAPEAVDVTLRSRLARLPRVVLRGPADDTTLAALYRGAAVVVVPSLYEGFGLPALEAMACGAPVVTSSGGSLPEVAAGAGLVTTGEPSALTDAITDILENPILAADLRAKGQARALQFTWDETATATLRALEEATS